MKKCKFLRITVVLMLTITCCQAAVTLSGTAVEGNFLSEGETVVVIADTTGSGFDAGTVFNTSLSGSLGSGLDITDGSIYGAGVTFLDSTTVGLNFLSVPFIGINTTFDLGTVSEGDEFALVLFSSSSTTTVASDTYSLYTNSLEWTVPGDSGANTLDTVTTESTFGGTVVPEPSAFGLIAGCFGLAWVMLRRRA